MRETDDGSEKEECGGEGRVRKSEKVTKERGNMKCQKNFRYKERKRFEM